MGHGDSEGRFEDATIETRLEDIREAGRFLSTTGEITALGLLGLRFGATAAALAADREANRYRHLILWEPIPVGLAYMQEMLRVNLATQLASFKAIRTNRKELVKSLQSGESVNVDGYELTGPLFQQASEIDLLQNAHAFAGSALIVGISRQHSPPNTKLEELASLYGACRLASVVALGPTRVAVLRSLQPRAIAPPCHLVLLNRADGSEIPVLPQETLEPGRLALAMARDAVLYGYDPQPSARPRVAAHGLDGHRLWSVEVPAGIDPGGHVTAIAPQPGRIYGRTHDGGVFCLEAGQ